MTNLLFFFVSLTLHIANAQWLIGGIPNTVCPLGPCALSEPFGRQIPRTCISTNRGKRCYYTYVPDCAGEKSPLVYDIHGFISCPLVSTTYTGWKELADEKCIVVVWPTVCALLHLFQSFYFPEWMCYCILSALNLSYTIYSYFMKGNVRFFRTNFPCWAVPDDIIGVGSDPIKNASPCCCRNADVQVNADETQDLNFLRAIGKQVVRDVPQNSNGTVTIDTKRIYMAGHSNGCMLAMAMAMKHSDFVAAVCCHIGSIRTNPGIDYSPTPIWFAHGEEDEVVPYEGNDLFPGAQATFNHLSTINGCNSTNINAFSQDEGGTVQTASGCENNATIEFMTVYKAPHQCYRGTRIKYDTTADAWNFCARYQSAEEPNLD